MCQFDLFLPIYSHVKQPTAEQIRIAQITEIGSGPDDPKMREKVANLMEMTQRTEEEVCCALYECDNDLERAVEFLLETLPVVSNSFFVDLFLRAKSKPFIKVSNLLTYERRLFCLFFHSEIRVRLRHHPKRKRIVWPVPVMPLQLTANGTRTIMPVATVAQTTIRTIMPIIVSKHTVNTQPTQCTVFIHFSPVAKWCKS